MPLTISVSTDQWLGIEDDSKTVVNTQGQLSVIPLGLGLKIYVNIAGISLLNLSFRYNCVVFKSGNYCILIVHCHTASYIYKQYIYN